jgi:hypothetical protein
VFVIAKCSGAIRLLQRKKPGVGNKAGTKGSEVEGLAGLVIPPLLQINRLVDNRFYSLIISATDITEKKA